MSASAQTPAVPAWLVLRRLTRRQWAKVITTVLVALTMVALYRYNSYRQATEMALSPGEKIYLYNERNQTNTACVLLTGGTVHAAYDKLGTVGRKFVRDLSDNSANYATAPLCSDHYQEYQWEIQQQQDLLKDGAALTEEDFALSLQMLENLLVSEVVYIDAKTTDKARALGLKRKVLNTYLLEMRPDLVAKAERTLSKKKNKDLAITAAAAQRAEQAAAR